MISLDTRVHDLISLLLYVKSKKNIGALTQPAHDVRTTLLQRYFNV